MQIPISSHFWWKFYRELRLKIGIKVYLKCIWNRFAYIYQFQTKFPDFEKFKHNGINVVWPVTVRVHQFHRVPGVKEIFYPELKWCWVFLSPISESKCSLWIPRKFYWTLSQFQLTVLSLKNRNIVVGSSHPVIHFETHWALLSPDKLQ